MKSTMFSLKTRDFLRGLVMALIVPALLIIQQSITAGELVFNWKSIWMASVAGGVGYLLKNLFTDDIKVAKEVLAKENIVTVKVAAPNDAELTNK